MDIDPEKHKAFVAQQMRAQKMPDTRIDQIVSRLGAIDQQLNLDKEEDGSLSFMSDDGVYGAHLHEEGAKEAGKTVIEVGDQFDYCDIKKDRLSSYGYPDKAIPTGTIDFCKELSFTRTVGIYLAPIIFGVTPASEFFRASDVKTSAATKDRIVLETRNRRDGLKDYLYTAELELSTGIVRRLEVRKNSDDSPNQIIESTGTKEIAPGVFVPQKIYEKVGSTASAPTWEFEYAKSAIGESSIDKTEFEDLNRMGPKGAQVLDKRHNPPTPYTLMNGIPDVGELTKLPQVILHPSTPRVFSSSLAVAGVLLLIVGTILLVLRRPIRLAK